MKILANYLLKSGSFFTRISSAYNSLELGLFDKVTINDELGECSKDTVWTIVGIIDPDSDYDSGENLGVAPYQALTRYQDK